MTEQKAEEIVETKDEKETEVEQAAVVAEEFREPAAQVEPPLVAPSDSDVSESGKEPPTAEKKEKEKEIEEAKAAAKGKGKKKAAAKGKGKKKAAAKGKGKKKAAAKGKGKKKAK